MADRKITELTALSAGGQATGDLLTIVDVSESAAADKNKKITVENLFKGIPGDVGIGTASPQGNSGTNLHIHGSNTTAELRLTNTTTGTGANGSIIQQGGNNLYISNSEAGNFAFENNGSERMRIDSSGRLLVGSTAGDGQLEVRSGTALGIISRSTSTQGTDSNKALRVRNNSNTDTFSVSYRGQGYFASRLLLGLTTARANFFNASNAPQLQLESTGLDGASASIARNSNNAFGSALLLGKTRGTSVGANTVVQSGDTIGSISFQGADGSELVEAATISSAVDTTPGANDMPGRLVFSTTADAASSPTERMRITSGGDVGIGTTSPALKLHVEDSVSQLIRFARTGTGAGSLDVDFNGNAVFNSHTTGKSVVFHTQSSERMRIDSSGDIRIGQTTSSSPADDDVRGVAIQGAGVLSACNTGARAIEIGRTENDSNSREVLRWFRNGNLVQTITTTATTVNYPTGSDYRLKENVIEMTGAIDRVKQLSPKRFNFIAEPGVEKDGFIAHELETVVPQAVVGTKDQVDESGNPVWQGVDHSFMVPLLTGALREAIAKIETLEAKVAALEAQ